MVTIYIYIYAARLIFHHKYESKTTECWWIEVTACVLNGGGIAYVRFCTRDRERGILHRADNILVPQRGYEDLP